MEKQKTAVEWLIDTINKINHDYEVGIIDEALWSIQTYEAHKQAKEMEKEQKLKYQLFIGKVSEIIGDEKTFELLKECQETIKSE
jgi:hypothetical protein